MTQLFGYQIEGAIFASLRRHVLLADEMGLGKTAQAIAAADLTNAERVLVLCPASARLNWVREFKKFSPRQREPTVICNSTILKLTELTVCSYDLATKKKIKQLLLGVQWDLLILDESHYLKNPEAERTKAALGKNGVVHRAKRVLPISGTPSPNHAGELWVVMYTFGVTKLSYEAFLARYCEGYDADHGWKVTGNKVEHLPELREKLEKILMRRKKSEVLKELPPMRFDEVLIEPSPVDIARWFPEAESAGLLEQLDVEAELMRRVLIGNLEDLRAEFHTATLRRYTGLSKVPGVIELLKDDFESGLDKIVVFAVHRDVIDLLAQGLREYNPVTLYGGMSVTAKQESVDRFQNDQTCRLFLGNVQAAGTNITLTAAAELMFVESSWSPSDNAQCAMRIHRIGQQRKCRVRFVALNGSIDRDVQAALRRKIQTLSELYD